MKIKPKRGTRAQLEASALAGTLIPDEICFITDEDKIAVCKSASTYVTYSADVAGGDNLKHYEVTRNSNVFNIDLLQNKHQIINIDVVTPFSITFSNWPVAPNTGMVFVELVNAGLATGISFAPAVKFFLPNRTLSTNFNDLNITLNSASSDFIMFWSKDGGTNIFAKVMG